MYEIEVNVLKMVEMIRELGGGGSNNILLWCKTHNSFFIVCNRYNQQGKNASTVPMQFLVSGNNTYIFPECVSFAFFPTKN